MFWRLCHARALLPLWFALLLPPAGAQMAAAPAIRNVTFEHTAALSAADQQQITQMLQQEDPAWLARQPLQALAGFVKNVVSTAYQDRGYWRAKIFVNVTWLKGRGESRQVDVLVTATDEGAQYSLKGIRFIGATVFPSDDLLRWMPIHPGELMSRTKVETGLEAMRGRYAERGYIAFAAIPHAGLDDATHLVQLDITLQEDSPFRFGNLSTEGVDPVASQALHAAWDQVRNELYSADKLRAFLSKALELPAGADPLDYSSTSLDFDTHTVDLFVSLPPATQAEKTAR
jgi:outer membrane protein assembly factor BamA